MKKTALVIMAAGIGSRYGGGIKQLEAVGPNGEIIMDYSIHDALEAGFNKVIFIIRRDLEEEFRRLIGDRIEKVTEVAYAFQELSDLPEGFSLPEGRTKPWGTGQAILAAKDVISEPFCVINADDYYGREGYRALHQALVETEDCGTGEKQRICMTAFVLGNTLSDNGGVTRGILELKDSGELIGIRETKNIIRTAEGASAIRDDGLTPLDTESLVSMNMWGLQPSFVNLLENGFREFLSKDDDTLLTREYLLPDIIDRLVGAGKAEVEVLKSEDTWFGVTYREDRDSVRESIAKLVEEGVYRTPLYE